MDPLAQTLALLAMAVATAAIEVVPLDMAQNSFDDQYLKCSDSMTKSLPELQHSDFLNNSWFANVWENATKSWQNMKTPSSPLTREQAIAIIAYSTLELGLYGLFNTAVHEGGSSSWKYRDEFRYKSMHFLLTRAVQTLTRPNDCRDVFRAERGVHFKVKEGDQVRFGQFGLMHLRITDVDAFRVGTMFKVYTCHGVDIQKFSTSPWLEEVLIPPFETFRVSAVSKEGDTMHMELRSTGTFSNYNCEWLKGGSLPTTSLNLWGLLLLTMAMAAVSGTL